MEFTSENKVNRAQQIPRVKGFPPETRKGFPIPKEEIEGLRDKSRETLLFTFQFFDRDHEAFNLGHTEKDWYISLMDCLREVCRINRHELMVVQKNHYQAHVHDWDKLDYKYKLDDDFLIQVECCQFSLTKSTGRVHGFIIGNRFYVVWLDPHHNLYPSERHGGREFYTRPLTTYEKLLVEHENLKEGYQDLREKYQDLYSLLDKETS